MVSSLASVLAAEGAVDLLINELVFRQDLRDSRGLIHCALRHKTLGMVAQAATTRDPGLGISQRLQQAAAAESLRCLRAAACAVQVSQLLTEAGCRPLLVKGVALSAQTTGRSDARGVGDVDVIVPPDKLTVAVSAMRQAGARPRASSALHPETTHAVTVDWRGTSVDIHRRLTHSPAFSLPLHGDVWRRSVAVDLGGAAVRTLHPSDAALHIAINSAHDSWSQVIRVADLARLLRISERDPRGPSLAEIARSPGGLPAMGTGPGYGASAAYGPAAPGPLVRGARRPGLDLAGRRQTGAVDRRFAGSGFARPVSSGQRRNARLHAVVAETVAGSAPAAVTCSRTVRLAIDWVFPEPGGKRPPAG